MKTFPILRQGTKAKMPKSVPWEFSETFRAQAEANHGQTLERLAARGGLSPEEMWIAAHGKGLRCFGEITEADALAWLSGVESLPPRKTDGGYVCPWAYVALALVCTLVGLVVLWVRA